MANENDATYEFVVKQEVKVNGAQMPTMRLTFKTLGMKQETFNVKIVIAGPAALTRWKAPV